MHGISPNDVAAFVGSVSNLDYLLHLRDLVQARVKELSPQPTVPITNPKAKGPGSRSLEAEIDLSGPIQPKPQPPKEKPTVMETAPEPRHGPVGLPVDQEGDSQPYLDEPQPIQPTAQPVEAESTEEL